MKNGHWLFCRQMDPKKYEGFIYIIRDNILERFYLGKKPYKSASGKPSPWMHYMSSSSLLKAMWEERPLSEFQFFVLDEYKTRGGLSYAETWTLCFVEAPTTLTWYNKRIEKISWNVKEPISALHKERLKEITCYKI